MSNKTQNNNQKITTPRDQVWSTVVKSDRLKWTTNEMLCELDDVSEHTIRDTFNAMVDEGILSHKKRSEYWYVDPQYT